MADIELIIKIDENAYRRIQALVMDDYFKHDIYCYSMRRIADGTPLPKGHGDLIDRNELLKQPMDSANYPSNYVRIAPTIIEADKAESENNNE